MPATASKQKRKRAFTADQLEHLASQLTSEASRISTAAAAMRAGRIRAVEVDGGRFPIRGLELLRTFFCKLQLGMNQSGSSAN